jgi:hypothetical protein
MNRVTAHLLEISYAYQGIIACEWVDALMDHDMCMKGKYVDDTRTTLFHSSCKVATWHADVFIGH